MDSGAESAITPFCTGQAQGAKTPLGFCTGPARPQLQSFALVLRPLPGWRIPPEQRLRAALKRLLRSYGLRCVSCKPAPDDSPPASIPRALETPHPSRSGGEVHAPAPTTARTAKA